jgi:hypothetical protein
MADQSTDDDRTAAEAAVSAQDETKRRFREALEHKHHQRHATAEAAGKDGSEKSHGATGPTKSRTFRRKSG